jgi:ATP-dependent DNA helicase RecQ
LSSLDGNGIVYCLTVRDTHVVASWLNDHGISAAHYSGPVESERRIEVEEALLRNRIKAVVATSALGMGYDKPDLGFVVHFQTPGSPIAYYQQVGRAGRAVSTAHAVLLRGVEDREIQDYFIRQAFPPPDQIAAVLRRLEADESVSANELLREVNVGVGRLETMLKSLAVDGVIERHEGRWQRTDEPWTYDAERIRAVTEQRRQEQAAMESYGRDGRCLMEALRRELDDRGAQPCGRCAVCTEAAFGRPLSSGLVRQAVHHLRGQEIPVRARAMSPSSEGGRRAIPHEERVGEGRALSVYGDAGWGHLVRKGKFEDNRFADELVDACVGLVREWNPEPTPTWITAVPSRRRAELVPDFAERLADALGITFVPAVRKVRETLEQKQMENSAQQLANVEGAFEVDESDVRSGPVLLIDDIVDSGWTLTEVGRALRRAGVSAVHPLALASSATRD